MAGQPLLHPRRAAALDAVLALILLSLSFPLLLDRGHLALTPILVALTAPLVLRRRFPVHVFAIVAVAAFVQWLSVPQIGAYDLAVLVALYTVAAYADRPWALAALAVSLLGALLAWWRAESVRGSGLLGLIPAAVAVTAVWVLGRNMRTRRTYLAELEQRAIRLEREHDALARAAVAEERARIAREMHDVVAHHLTVIVAQADGAAHTIHGAPERAERAVTVIADAGRTALTELRRTLGVLRDHHATDDDAPQPTVADLPQLITAMRSTGLPVTYTWDGPKNTVDPLLGLNIYRIVQESLTNTLKHAGPGTPADVTIRNHTSAIDLDICDTGPAHHPPPRPGPATDASAAPTDPGHGLSGMHERVTMFAGQLICGPTPTGGWRVHATIPHPNPTAR